MGTASGLKKHHRVAAVGIVLIVAAVTVVGAACDPTNAYQLTISSSSGGSVTIPGQGIYTYVPGTVVQLVATPDDGYDFHSWSGDTTYIAGYNVASTTITMNGNCAILANFETRGGTGGTEGDADPTPSEPVPP